MHLKRIVQAVRTSPIPHLSFLWEHNQKKFYKNHNKASYTFLKLDRHVSKIITRYYE